MPLPIGSYLVLARLGRFTLVGAAGTVAHYMTLGLLVEGFRSPIIWASTFGAVVGALVNYVLNRRFTFESDAKHSVALPKFLTIATLGAACNWAVVAWLLQHSDFHYFVVQLFATGIVLLWNFSANSLWTFRS
jgi:putative flippase GtrA